MQQYEIILKNEKEKANRSVSWLLISVNFIILILLTIATGFKNITAFAFALLAVMSILLLKYFKAGNRNLALTAPLIFFALAWFFTSYWWIGLVNVIFFILDAAASRQIKVSFNEDQVRFSSLMSRTFLWNEISNAILKDGILTLDFKNNKIIQQQIDEERAFINEKEFNDFCNRQLVSIKRK